MQDTSDYRFKANWVLVDELAIGNPPRSPKDIGLLVNMGIKSILSLCSIEESENKNIQNEIKRYFNHEYSILPDHKSGRAPSNLEIEDALNKLLLLKKKGPVFVHCLAAAERSPIICMKYLMRFMHLDLITSLEYLRRVNKSTNPLKMQLDSIKFI